MCVSQDRFHTARRNGLYTLLVSQNRFHTAPQNRFYVVLYDRFNLILRNDSYFLSVRALMVRGGICV